MMGKGKGKGKGKDTQGEGKGKDKGQDTQPRTAEQSVDAQFVLRLSGTPAGTAAHGVRQPYAAQPGTLAGSAAAAGGVPPADTAADPWSLNATQQQQQPVVQRRTIGSQAQLPQPSPEPNPAAPLFPGRSPCTSYLKTLNKIALRSDPRAFQQQPVFQCQWRTIGSNVTATQVSTGGSLPAPKAPVSDHNETSSPWWQVSTGGSLPVQNVHALGDLPPTRQRPASYNAVVGVDPEEAFDQVSPEVSLAFKLIQQPVQNADSS